MNQARVRLDSRFGAMPEGTVASIAKTIGETGLVIIDANRTNTRFQTLSKCPACDEDTAALFLATVPETTLLYEMELTAEGLLCGLCDLRLTGEEEIRIAGLPPTIRCKVEDLTETIDDGPLVAGNMFTHLTRGTEGGPLKAFRQGNYRGDIAAAHRLFGIQSCNVTERRCRTGCIDSQH